MQFQHRPGNKEVNLSKVAQFSELAHRAGAHIVAFPEMCITGYWHVRNLSRSDIADLAEPVPGGASTKRLLHLSRQFHLTIGAGLIERAPDGNLYNTYVVALSDGRTLTHRKLHCFISEHMASGDSYTVFQTPEGWQVGVLTCYDNNIIENARITALSGAEILMAPHQTGGCASRSPRAMGRIDVDLWERRHDDPETLRSEFTGPKGRQWLMRWLPARAHDNGMYLLFSNGVGRDDDEVRTGNAMIIDPYGEIAAETSAIEDDMVVADCYRSLLEQSSGRRWLQARRPELYAPIVEATGKEDAIRTVRFG